MILRETVLSKWALLLLALVLLSNVLLYQTAVQDVLRIDMESGIILGSLLDMVVVAPILAYAAFRVSKKQVIGFMIAGLVLARFMIPEEFFAPYTILLYAGVGFEALLFLAELSLIGYLVWKIPVVRAEMRRTGEGAIFSMLPAAERTVGSHPLIKAVVSEVLMFYYSLFSWRHKAPIHEGCVTMHKKTSALAMNIMVIHAVVIESIGLHWWLHSKWPILSIILLFLNVYGVFLFLAEIAVMRLHPLEVKNGRLYVTQGLVQRIVVPLDDIEKTEWGVTPGDKTMTFMYRDLEQSAPQVVLHFKEPVESTLFMGRKRMVSSIALKVDHPEKLKQLLLS
ncbi:hypothetical protein LCM10_11835 [Rossellomorea aquimaris]|uniref:hypothetical protein n=1 Tax=Rossellomorea aquimaris TaxID=189382 RepID=UPI001CD21898|nr:hypothetical protein [Rossellomorea aquimaris]MCA1055677.1 hypothetical protein [Rossellomorea aquimaris]